MAIKVGDRVNYVPDQCHALIFNLTAHPDKGIVQGDYPWVIGHKDRHGEVEEVEGQALRLKLKSLKRSRSSLAREGLELIRPKVTWPAVVTTIHGDKYDLDVDAPNTAVTLHVTVKEDATGKLHHTCHAVKEESKGVEVLREAPELPQLKEKVSPAADTAAK